MQLRLSGGWTLEADIPDTTGLIEKIGSTESVSRVSFDSKRITAWDTALLIFLTPLSDYCRQQEIEIEPAGLPKGVGKILDLAYAVPERKDARRQPRKRSFFYVDIS